jgi:hypothetical protein
MVERQGIERLTALQRRWKAEGFVYCLLLGVSVGLPLGATLWGFFGWPGWVGALVFLTGCITGGLLSPYRRLSLADIASYLDRQLPELEESSGLLLKPVNELGPLEQLQAKRMEAKFAGLSLPRPMRRKLGWSGLLLCIAIVFSGVVLLIGIVARGERGVGRHHAVAGVSERQAPVAAPGVRAVNITITPPAYTGKVGRSQAVFPLRAEEGALLNWEVTTSGAADTVSFRFNDTLRRLLRPADGSRTVWRLAMQAVHPGFYQVSVGAQHSDLYQLEVVKDEPPKITIRSPRGYTLLDYGESTKIPLLVKLQDDYGISDAEILATVSSGKGEAVKFKQQELRWGNIFTGGHAVYDLSKTLDLTAMGLKPGDELYFYCRAKDNHGQEARSDMYIISLADTAQLMSMEGLTMAMDVKPEFFRSERQIIIETELLLSQKDTLDAAVFKEKSNVLGIDQKLLRLRYGKFLGEEAEEGEPGGAGKGVEEFGDAAKILDAYTDKHDNAEDATYFEPAIKAQLKATLSEMWKAELQLRTYKPKDALPYAYKALRLLKDLQQQSRSFVAKTGVRLSPLNPARRLTGELGAIRAPGQRAERPPGLTEEEVLRIVLALLDGGRIAGAGSRVLMAQAERRLGAAASARPGEFLAGYQAMRRVVAEVIPGGGDAASGGDVVAGAGEGDVLLAQQAMRKLLPGAQAVPVGRKVQADAGLSQLYFSHIDKP